MKYVLSEEEIANYRENGFLVIEGFLDPDELEEWRCAVDEAVLSRGEEVLPWEPHFSDSTIFKQRIQLWMDNDRIKDLMLDERIGKMAADLEGVSGVRIWHDQALIKMPWANPTSWHQDNPKWSFTSDCAISIWIALDNVTPHNGCMYFLPRSHKKRFKEVATNRPMSEIFDINPELGEINPVSAPMRAGSCSFHNGLTAHGAGANMTRGLRRAMTCAFMPDGSTFNGLTNVLPQSYVDTLSVGDLLDNDALNPLIYHSSVSL
jgi:ectoine hydroxylase-related dioxygenase (phytanoyl-CoA dioxygenase family)